MKLIDKDTNKDAIIKHLTTPDADVQELSYKQRQLLDYYSDAYAMVRNYNSVPDVIAVLVKVSISKGEPISKSTARRYVYDAQDVYGYISKTKPEAIKHLAAEIIKDAIAMAREQERPDLMIAGAKELVKVTGADEVEGFNAEMLEQHNIIINLDEKAAAMLGKMTAKGSIDLDTLMGNVMNTMADDAEIVEDGTGN